MKINSTLVRQLWRFALVGIAGFAVNAGMVETLVKATGPVWAQVIAFPVAATVTWWANRRYTFNASVYRLHHEWLRYILANTVGGLVNNGAYMAMIFTLPLAYKHPALAVAAGSLAGMVFNFIASKKIVFSINRGEHK